MNSGGRILLSIVIPARNEEALLPGCLRSIRRAAKGCAGEIETIVVLNRCTDRTEEIARAAGCLLVREDAKNLSVIRNAGVRAASGKVVVTLDADSRLSVNALHLVQRALSDPKVVGGAVPILPERWSMGIAVTGLMLLPVAARHWISGGMFYFRREDFDAIGGFDTERRSIEDVDFAIRLKRYGRQTGRSFQILWRAYIVTSCRKFDRFGDWYIVRHPIDFFSLFRGKHPDLADKLWYDFKH